MQPHAPTKAPCCSGHKPQAVSQAGVSPVDAKTAAYICPMCEGVGSSKPGACPKCGMDLEKNPLAVSSTPECCGDGGAAELSHCGIPSKLPSVSSEVETRQEVGFIHQFCR